MGKQPQVHNLIIDSLVAKKEHQDKDKIAEKEKEVSSELNKLRDQQELIVDLMAKELSLR